MRLRRCCVSLLCVGTLMWGCHHDVPATDGGRQVWSTDSTLYQRLQGTWRHTHYYDPSQRAYLPYWEGQQLRITSDSLCFQWREVTIRFDFNNPSAPAHTDTTIVSTGSYPYRFLPPDTLLVRGNVAVTVQPTSGNPQVLKMVGGGWNFLIEK